MAVRSAALVSDAKRIRGVYTRRCAIQVDNLYLLPLPFREVNGTETIKMPQIVRFVQSALAKQPNSQFNAVALNSVPFLSRLLRRDVSLAQFISIALYSKIRTNL